MPKPIELHGVAQYDGPAGLTSLPIVSGVYTLSKPDVCSGALTPTGQASVDLRTRR